jgi:hypothetical protein
MKRKKTLHAYIEREREGLIPESTERGDSDLWSGGNLSPVRSPIPTASDRRKMQRRRQGDEGVRGLLLRFILHWEARVFFFFSRENKVEKFSRPALSRKPNAYERKVYLGPFVPVHYGLFDYTNVLSLDATYAKSQTRQRILSMGRLKI